MDDKYNHNLFDRLNNLKSQTTVDKSKINQGLLEEVHQNISIVSKTLLNINKGLFWIYIKIINPLFNFLPIFNKLWQIYKSLWMWFCYPAKSFFQDLKQIFIIIFKNIYIFIINLFIKNNHSYLKFKSTIGAFSKKRAGLFILLSLLFFSWPLQIPVIKDLSYAIVYEPPYDFTRISVNFIFYGGKIRTEKLYLNGKTEINPEDNIWSLYGCEFKINCPPEDAVYFRIKPSLIHWLWSLSTKGLPFIADDLAGVVPNVPSECTVKSYGARWRIMKWLQSYPVVLDVNCKVITN